MGLDPLARLRLGHVQLVDRIAILIGDLFGHDVPLLQRQHKSVMRGLPGSVCERTSARTPDDAAQEPEESCAPACRPRWCMGGRRRGRRSIHTPPVSRSITRRNSPWRASASVRHSDSGSRFNAGVPSAIWRAGFSLHAKRGRPSRFTRAKTYMIQQDAPRENGSE